ncbi:Glycosyltransferase Gtf1 [bioreactor metagenome]|uniref:Glycosyltransferase Gtf1 n=1 Tax=bioreactor metagenome TaxID=1076179 RepID=A0A645GLN2_9ZZZZ
MRSELNLENQLVIGHVGRFTDQKNHTFLIDIFFEIHKQKQNSRLILVGSGDKEDEIKEKVNTLGISDSVLFIGFKSDVSDYMQVMDMFLFPSKFEGLGLVLIEAQAAGLPSFTSASVVPEEAKVTDLLQYISLKKSAETWAKIILDATLQRKDTYNEICSAGYEIKSAAYKLEKFYLNRLE